MPSSILLSDNGASSASAGLKQTAGNDGVLILQTTTSGGTATNAIYVDTSQNVGVGTSSPESLTNFKFLDVGSSSTNQGVLQANNGTVKTAIYSNGTEGYVATRTSHNLNFQTGGTTRATIDSSGNLLVGTTSNPNSSKMLVTASPTSVTGIVSAAEFRQGGTSENGGQIALLNTYSGASNPNKWLRVDNSGSFNVVNSAYNAVPFILIDGGNLTISGSTATKASGTTWANPSDQRLKDNVVDYAKGLAELMQVRVCTWTYNGKGGTTEGAKGLGVIADEIMQVLPETVDTYEEKLNKTDEQKTEIKRFDATEITWLLVKAIQELKAELDTAKEQIAILQGAQQ